MAGVVEAPAPRRWSILPVVELLLTALTVSVALGFWRIFEGTSFAGPLVVLAVAAHLVAAGTRRAGAPLALAGLASAAAMALAVVWTLYPHTTTMGLPTSLTVEVVQGDLGEVWSQFKTVKAPTAATTPLLLAAGVALWWAAFVADWAAFRLSVPFEAVIPPAAVFVFVSLFATDHHRVAATALFLAATLGFLLTHRVWGHEDDGGWMGPDPTRARAWLLRRGAAAAVATVAIAVLIGPQLPTAMSEGVVDLNPESKPVRMTNNPLVDIRAQLQEQSQEPMLRVTTDRPAYWRETSLDTFDGEVWRSNGRYRTARRSLPAAYDGGVPAQRIDYEVEILAPGTVWVPTAFEARSFQADDGLPRSMWEKETSTLIIADEVETADGYRYRATSEVPVPDPAAIEAASGDIPGDVAERNLGLPADFSPRVMALAHEITAEASSPYAKAKALQDHLRGNYTYDLGVDLTLSSSAIESFLFDVRSGFCQQFAGSFAAMARAVGLPARVAVGYNVGTPDGEAPGTYVVRGKDRHAWPEVFIAGVGWLTFEPTPGRGAPFADVYNGVVPQSDDGPTAPPTEEPANPEDPEPAPAVSEQPDPTAPDGSAAPGGAPDPSFDDDEGSTPPPWWGWRDRGALGRTLLISGWLVVAAALYAMGVPRLWAWRRARRRARAVGPDGAVAVAWQEVVESLGPTGLAPAGSESPTDFAARLGPSLGDERVRWLAGTVEAAWFAPTPRSEADAAEAYRVADALRVAVAASLPPARRWADRLDPRPPRLRRPLDSTWRGGGDGPRIEIVVIDPSS